MAEETVTVQCPNGVGPHTFPLLCGVIQGVARASSLQKMHWREGYASGARRRALDQGQAHTRVLMLLTSNESDD